MCRVCMYSLVTGCPPQNGQKQTDPGSLEDLTREEGEGAAVLSEPISMQRKSPLVRNRKTGSMEVRRTPGGPRPIREPGRHRGHSYGALGLGLASACLPAP